MKNVSNEYKTIAESLDGSARYYHQILVDGVELTDTIVEFKYSHTCNNSTNFSVGNTASAMVEFKIDEPSINLENKEIQVNQGLKLANGNMEYVKLGKFKVLSPEIERFQANYQCVDAMTYKMATVYESALTYPTTDIAILEEICQQAGIELVNDNLVAHTIDKKLDNYTKREIIGFISQLQGKNAIINTDGKLELIWYTQTGYVVDDNRIYSDRTDIIKNENDYVLGYIKSTYGSKEIVSGDIDTQGIRITNPYMTQDILDEVFNKIKGLRFRAINVDFYGDFRLEVGDIVTVNTNNESYVVPIMTLEQSSDGGVVTSIESIGETSTQNSVDTNGGILNEIKRSVVNSETARTIAEQSADKINFVVEGDSVSEFTITDKALNIIAKNIDLTGKVTFNSFDEETKDALSNISEPIKEAEGSPILLTDSAESNLIDFKAYGRSTQDGTPTPDAPVDIVSVGKGGTLEVKSTGKNLLPYPYTNTTKTVNGITFTDNGDGSITMNGTATADTIFLLSPVSLKAGTYTLSVNDSGFNTNYCNFQMSNSENNIWWGFKAETSSIGTRTYTLDEDLLFNYNRLLVKSGHTMNNVTWKPMVRRTEITDDTYEPYKSSTVSIPLAEPLRSVGEVRDEIACVDGVYGVIRRIGSKLFDGSSDENWWESRGNTVVDEFTLEFDAFMGTNSEMLCSHFAYNRNSNEVGTFRNYHSTAWTQPYQVYVMFAEYGTTTVTKLREWLQANPITIDYILAQETFEPFADQTLFYNIKTFDSITFITATDNAEMKVEYFRNTSTGQQLSNANSNANNALNKANSVDSTLSSLCVLENNVTVIDGSKIYTGSVTADKIDVYDLFAQTITAKGSITGAKLYGTYAEIEGGKIGGFELNEGILVGIRQDGKQIMLSSNSISWLNGGQPCLNFSIDGLTLAQIENQKKYNIFDFLPSPTLHLNAITTDTIITGDPLFVARQIMLKISADKIEALNSDGETISTLLSTDSTGETIIPNLEVADTTKIMGDLLLYGDKGKYTQLKESSNSANITITLPNKNGTLALNTVANTSANGLMSKKDKSKLDGIGTVLEVLPSAVSLSSQNDSTGTAIASLKLPVGTYMVTCAAHFPAYSSSAGTYRRATLSTTSGKIDAGRGVSNIAAPINGQTTMVHIGTIIQVTAETTYYLNAQHNSSESLSVSGQIKAVRIG